MLELYILMWPALAFVILVILVQGVLKDVRQAKKDGNDLV